MKMLEDGRAAQKWASCGDPAAAREAPTAHGPRPKRRDPPLTAYGDARDLYAAMAAAREANLAKLAAEAPPPETAPQPSEAAADPLPRNRARVFRWALVLGAAALAAVKGARRPK